MPNKPIITKLPIYRHHGEAPLCRACHTKRSAGRTLYGATACVMCQLSVDTYIAANFEIRQVNA
jgi:hypothetical protein